MMPLPITKSVRAVRQHLISAFPYFHYQVSESERVVTVSWIDGPTETLTRQVVQQLFDTAPELQRSIYRLDYVRNYSPETLRTVATKLLQATPKGKLPDIGDHNGEGYILDDHAQRVAGKPLYKALYQAVATLDLRIC
jgi:hypothetical protein